MQFKIRRLHKISWRLLPLLVLLLLSLACATTSPEGPQPIIASTPSAPSYIRRQLGFLHQGDVWMVSLDSGVLEQVTTSGDVLNFTWASDGDSLATFNGSDLCLTPLNESPPPGGETSAFCIDQGATGAPYFEPQILLWSSDQQTILIGGEQLWLLIPLDNQIQITTIQDAVQWGVSLPGNNEGIVFLGQPLFLPDGSLLGTFTQDAYCGSGGCTYSIYQQQGLRQPFTNFSFSGSQEVNMAKHLKLTGNEKNLVNYGHFQSGCETFASTINIYNLESKNLQQLHLDDEIVQQVAPSMDGSQVIITRTAGCSSLNTNQWAVDCGLSSDVEVYPMQLWKLESSNPRSDIGPGLDVTWSPDDGLLAFQSCLEETSSGSWRPSASGPPKIYIRDMGSGETIAITEGKSPVWRP